jgi:two-component system sensor histidine kinase KdpD
LATITGASSSLLDEGTTDPRVRMELLRGIHTEAQRLNELIGNLVFATRLEAGKVALRCEWTSLEEVVGAALHRLRDALADHPLKLDVAQNLPLVQADPALLEQAVHLLLENAVRHTPAATPLRVRAFVLGSEAAIEVADDGPGIAEADRLRVFQRFVRGPRSSGMGLGLPICAAILKAHGGSAVLMPTTGRGAVFQLRLPLPAEPPPPAPEAMDGKPGDHG